MHSYSGYHPSASQLESPAVEIIQDKLYWISGNKPPTSDSNAYYFCVDNELNYDPFHKDFGPLNLAKMHKYVREVVRLLQDPNFKDQKLYHYCSNKFDKQANSCFLMGAFMIVVLKLSAETVWEEYFHPYHQQIIPFRDASYGDCTYECTIYHCLKGLEFAIKLGWYSFKDFDPREYEYYEKVENGDLNWVVPGKFIAFMGPIDRKPGQSFEQRNGNSPEDYIEVFRHFGVTHVIRLNEPTKYDRQKFVKNGIKHSELYFIDGSTPSESILNEFMRISEQEKGALAVHCKAGLGRTGTLIGCYAMKHFKFPAAAFIGWIRIARPGSILGPQQYYLLDKEDQMFGRGPSNSYYSKSLNRQRISEMSPEDKKKSIYGDKRQGDKLVNKKFSTPSYHATASMHLSGPPMPHNGANTTPAGIPNGATPHYTNLRR